MSRGIFQHPEWYPDLSSSSPFEDCYGAVKWAMDTGITSNPEWYPDLTSSSPFEAFQAHLHSIDHGQCPMPCPSVPAAPSCMLQITYLVKNCTRFSRCGIAGRSMETGRCVEPRNVRDGHYVRVSVPEGSTTCADVATVRVDYFANDTAGDCSGSPYSSMVIATNGTELVDDCRDIYGNLWTDYKCRAAFWSA